MSILVNKNTRVICQGFTGKQGTFHSRAVPRLRHASWSAASRRAAAARSTSGLPVFDTVRDAVAKTGANATHDLRAAAVRGRRDPRSGGCRHRADRVHHRGHPGASTWSRSRRRCRDSAVAADRPELPGRHHAGRMQDRHHAGLHPQDGQGRHRLALGHADLRSRVPDHQRRPRPEHLRRHRRRSGARHELHRRARAVRAGSADRRHHHGRRDRRQRRRGRRGVHPQARHQAGRRATSPASRRRRASAWVTPARSSRAARARPPTSSRRSKRRACTTVRSPAELGAAIFKRLKGRRHAGSSPCKAKAKVKERRPR